MGEGFRIGFNRSHSLRQAGSNMTSVHLQPEAVDHYIKEEVAASKLVPGPARPLSPIGLIPKKNRPGKFRLIVDLSSPRGCSINNGIASSNCSFRYSSVHDAAKRVVECGRGALMAKLDLKSAYRMVPVHPEDSSLLDVSWRGVSYLDQALPFGLRSAPIIFSTIADGLAWALHQSGVDYSLHYLDDFFCGPANSQSCSEALATAVPLCSRLGLPVALEKVEGPSHLIVFLGIKIDSVAMSLSLPEDKLQVLKSSLAWWVTRKSATKHQLQELLGHLNHAASVIRPGRIFLRSLKEGLRLPSQSSRLDAQARADLAWWCSFAPSWNGISMLPPASLSITVTSDASGGWGCGAFVSPSFRWVQVEWPASWASQNIAVKELFPVVIATLLWGREWRGSHVRFQSDNKAVVAALNAGSACHPLLAHLLRCLFFWQAAFDFHCSATHIPGRLNRAADALSRDNLLSFFSLFPQASPQPTPIP